MRLRQTKQKELSDNVSLFGVQIIISSGRVITKKPRPCATRAANTASSTIKPTAFLLSSPSTNATSATCEEHNYTGSLALGPPHI